MQGAQGGLQPALVQALITAAVAIIVAVVSQVYTRRREWERVRDDRRRETLLEVQKAVFDLRAGLRDYGTTLRTATNQASTLPILQQASSAPEDPTALAKQNDADAWLDVCLARVEDQDAVTAVTKWRSRATQHFISVEDVSVSEERADWLAVQGAIRNALFQPPQTRGRQFRERRQDKRPEVESGGANPEESVGR